MTGKGKFTQQPRRRFALMIGAHAVWLAAVGALGAWWATLVSKQAGRIHELETLAGLAVADERWVKTQRMLFWESGTYLALVLASSALLVFLYLRDHARNRSIQAFFASVTHELRTPLTSIRLQAESIAEQVGPSELIERLLQDTQRLESQVERMLELARVEGGGKLFVQSLRAKPWFQRLIRGFEEAHGDRLKIDAEIEDLVIEADASAVQVVFRNCIENSIRHSRKAPVHVRLKVESQGDRAVVRLQDDGSGVSGPAMELGKIFEKGVDSQGAGVGLYLVRALMERMGGQARFASGDGFTVELFFRKGQA